MRCPFGGAQDMRVIDSRLSQEGDQVRRRRECGECRERFTTYEAVELVEDDVMESLAITRCEFHGKWNYQIAPKFGLYVKLNGLGNRLRLFSVRPEPFDLCSGQACQRMNGKKASFPQ